LPVPPDPLRIYPSGRYWESMTEANRPLGRATVLFGLFVALETFLFLSQGDRWEVLLFITRETWLLVALLWLRNLALSAAAGGGAVFLLHAAWSGCARADGRGDRRLRRLEPILVLTLLALGVFLRWVDWRGCPPGAWHDGAYTLRPVLEQGSRIPWFTGAWVGDDSPVTGGVLGGPFLWLLSLGVALFPPGELQLFAVSAVPGCLALAGFWLLARELEGSATAAVALALGAVMRWPLLISRWMFTAAWLVALTAFAAAGAIRSLRTGRPGGALLAGLAAGLALNTYAAAWGVVPAFLAAWALAVRRDPVRRRTFLPAAVLVAAFAALHAGLLLLWGRPGGRVAEAGFWTPVRNPALGRGSGALDLGQRLADSTARSVGVFLWTADPVPRHGLPTAPPMTPLVRGAALTGFAVLVARAHRGERRAWIPLGLAAGALACGILSNPTAAPGTLRMSVLVVPTVVAAASAMVSLSAWLAPRGVRPAATLSLAGALLLVFETLPLFAVWPDRRDVRRSFFASETEIGRRLGRLAPDPGVREPGTLDSPLVVAIVSGQTDGAGPRRLAQRTLAGLVRNPPQRPVWWVGLRAHAMRLHESGLRISRPVAAEDGELAMARIVPGMAGALRP
jgi:hypothetical protein